MKQTTKRFWAREVVWFLYTLIALAGEFAIQFTIDRLWSSGNLHQDLDELHQMQTFFAYLFYGYLILAYPVRLVVYISKWAFEVLNENQKSGVDSKADA